jgi:3-phosphoshikimate 1-carboxyvinyltransferase
LKPLLTALEQLGGRFHYLNTPYFAPLKIEGRKLVSSTIQVTSNESSQYASSLLLIASFIEGGLRLQFDKTIKSLSYLNLTIDTLRQFGAIIYEEENCIQVEQKKLSPPLNLWPADWSSAPYFLALAACSNEANIFIQNIDKDPSQADFAAIEIFTRYFNIDCHFEKDGLRVQKKSSNLNQEEIQLNGSNFPDLVPTLFSCAAVLGRKISIEGIGHLRFKESDRIEVLKTELKKVGFEINQSQEDCWQGIPSEVTQTKTLEFSAHHDHRMAMSFSLFSLKFNNVRISGAESINKSFPTYWKTLSNLGFQFEIT